MFNQSRPFGFADVLSLDSCEHDPLEPETVSFSLHAACAKLSQLNVEGLIESIKCLHCVLSLKGIIFLHKAYL